MLPSHPSKRDIPLIDRSKCHTSLTYFWKQRDYLKRSTFSALSQTTSTMISKDKSIHKPKFINITRMPSKDFLPAKSNPDRNLLNRAFKYYILPEAKCHLIRKNQLNVSAYLSQPCRISRINYFKRQFSCVIPDKVYPPKQPIGRQTKKAIYCPEEKIQPWKIV